MKVGITSTIPVEVLMAAGHTPVDLNNRFISSRSPPPEDLVREAERAGLSPNLCSWVKGLYAYGLAGDVKTIVVASGGDCADMVALSDLWEEAGIEVIHFAYPAHRSMDALESAIGGLIDRFGTSMSEAGSVRERLEPVRTSLSRLDRLTWEWGTVTGEENHLWLVSSSDFGGDLRIYERELDEFLRKSFSRRDMTAMKRDVMDGPGVGAGSAGGGATFGGPPPPAPFGGGRTTGPPGGQSPDPSFSLGGFLRGSVEGEKEPEPPPYARDRPRIGIVGVPPIMPDIHDVISGHGGDVVYNESPFQFSMPYPADDLVEQYHFYTYPYGAKVRLDSVEEELVRRGLDGLILYQEAFCYRSIQNTYLRRHSPVPTLDIEASKPGPCDARTLLRLEAFVQMLRVKKERGIRPEALAGLAPPGRLLYEPCDAATRETGVADEGSPPRQAEPPEVLTEDAPADERPFIKGARQREEWR